MSRIGLFTLAFFLTGLVIVGPVFAQTFAAPGVTSATSSQQRSALAHKYNRKMPACKRDANRQHLIFDARRTFMRQCLKT